MAPLIAILTSSGMAFGALRPALELFKELSIEFEVSVQSAQHAPDQLRQWLDQAQNSGVELVLVAEAPGEMLGDFVYAHSFLPVIVLPLAPASPLIATGYRHAAQEALSSRIPAVGLERGHEAALAASRILALKHAELRRRLESYSKSQAERLRSENDWLRAQVESLQTAPGLPSGVQTPNAPAAPKAAAAPPPAAPPKAPSEEQKQRDLETLKEISRDFRPQLRTEWSKPAELPKRKVLDYSLSLREIISTARDIAAAYGCEAVQTEHFLAAMVDTPSCAAHRAMAAAGTDFDKLADGLTSHFPQPITPAPSNLFALDETASSILSLAKEIAHSKGHDCLVTTDLLEAILQMGGSLASSALLDSGLSSESLTSALADDSVPDECQQLSVCLPPAAEPPAELDPEAVAYMLQRLSSLGPNKVHSLSLGNDEPLAEEIWPTEEAEEKVTQVSQGEPTSPLSGSPAQDAESSEAEEPKPAAVIVCDPMNPSVETVELVTDTLLDGGVVAFPTDTVYGVGADATNEKAVARLYEVKGRPATKAIAVLIHSTALLKRIVRHVPPEIEPLLDKYWPGPLTVVFERPEGSLRAISAQPTIGVRIPDHYLALALLSMVGRPLATTSANLSGEADCVTAQQVMEQIGSRVDMVIDGGKAPGGVTSTVLSVISQPYRILRHGAISKAEIEKVLGMSVEG